MGIGKRATVVSADEIGAIVAGLGDCSQFLSRLAFTCDRIAGGLQEFDRQRAAVREQGTLPDPRKIADILAKNRDSAHVAEALERADFRATHRGGILLAAADQADKSILTWAKPTILSAMRQVYGRDWRLSVA